MEKHHTVENISVRNGELNLTVDGRNISVKLKGISPILDGASEAELAEFEVSPSGYGIHWPLLDEDISVDGLLGIEHKPNIGRKSA